MDYKKTLKKYVYERDGRKCFYCGKDLTFRQVSLDHYLPKSRNGPDDVFNIVLSCRKCNKFKKNTVPPDYESIMICNLKTAAKDKKIKLSGINKMKKEKLIEAFNEIDRIENIGEYTVFQSRTNRFYIKNNILYKIIEFCDKG